MVFQLLDAPPAKSNMFTHIPTLESRYLDSCKRHDLLPNSAVLLWFHKAKIQKARQEKCILVVLLDQLKDHDYFPLLDVFQAIGSSDIDGVDIFLDSHCELNYEYALSLMREVNRQLQIVDIKDISLGKDFLRDLLAGGLSCQVLNLLSQRIGKLDMAGRFLQLHTLNLDFCSSLTTLEMNCFSCMPRLMCLSMCETRVANLWSTGAALSKLHSLLELRFQKCLCCKDTGPCSASSREEDLLVHKRDYLKEFRRSINSRGNTCSKHLELPLPANVKKEMVEREYSIEDSSCVKKAGIVTEESGCSDVQYSSEYTGDDLSELFSTMLHTLKKLEDLQTEVSLSEALIRDYDKSILSDIQIKVTDTSIPLKKYTSHHPSPICFEKHYKEYIIALLPQLQVLDNLAIQQTERKMAESVFSKYFEKLAYGRRNKESILSVLKKRETGSGGVPKHTTRKSQYSYSRSLCSAKLGASAWPQLNPLPSFSNVSAIGTKRFRPRQFEYHPSDSSLMAFGTLDGEVFVINHENGKTVGYVPSMAATNSILGLCWLKKYPSKILAGSDDGSLKLYDINHMMPKVTAVYASSHVVTFDKFEQLTSVHANSTNNHFIGSGYSKNVAVYDISTGRRLHLFTDVHREPINVAKFAHHNPFIFATSSFDHDVKMWDLRQNHLQPCYSASSSKGNVMVCFSPDDQYLLVSAVDNEVKQLLAVDGRLHMDFEIGSTGSAHNYTRSYYMNGRDYIISGSCEEHVIRICCAQTGRRLRDICFEEAMLDTGKPVFVQSLRGDPFRDFHLSVLAAYTRPSSKWEIIKINLLSSSHHSKEALGL